MKTRTMIVFGLAAAYVGVQFSLCLALVPYNGSEGVYWQTLRQMAIGRKLYSEIFYSQWPLFIELARLSRFLPGTDLFAARIVLMLFSPLALYAAYRLIQKLVSPRAALISVGVLAMEPLFFNLSHQLTGEIPALALTLWALVCLLDPPFRKSWANHFASAILFGIAIQIKALMLLPLLASVIVCLAFSKTKFPSSLKAPAILGVGALVINLICLWGFDWFNSGGLNQLQGGLITYAFGHLGSFDLLSVGRTALRKDYYSLAFLFLTAPCLIYSLSVLYTKGERRLLLPIALCAGFFFLALSSQMKVNTDHLVIFTPLCALAFAALTKEVPKQTEWLLGSFIVLSLIFTGKELGWRYPMQKGKDLEAESVLIESTSKPSVVMGNALFLITSAGRFTLPEFTDFSAARAASGSITCAQIEHAFENAEVKAFVLRNKGLKGIPCDGRNVIDVVQAHFPKRVYEDSRHVIFLR